MHLKSLEIKGFKSIGEIKLIEPNPFTVFVGPNSVGKSNIFEALEFFNFCTFTNPDEAIKDFGGLSNVYPGTYTEHQPTAIEFHFAMKTASPELKLNIQKSSSNRIFLPVANFPIHPLNENIVGEAATPYQSNKDFEQLLNFTRLFVGRSELLKRKGNDDSRLVIDASNLEKVLKRIFKNEMTRDEIVETLQAFVPGFEDLKVEQEGRFDTLWLYEDKLPKPLPKNLISDGTLNLITILAALYQSNTPQFLCIEEPENGLNPKVARELVSVIRSICKDSGHFVWLNTHSPSIVSELTPDEVVLVGKKDGYTQVTQIKGRNLHGLRMDEALLSNALGGGVPW